jgi:hypothetical protein
LLVLLLALCQLSLAGLQLRFAGLQLRFISKYLSGLCKLDYVFVLKAGFETQLRAPRLSIPFGMSALGMTRQIGEGCLQGGIEPRHVPMLQGPDNVA